MYVCMTDHSPCIWHIHTWPTTLIVSDTYIHDRSLFLYLTHTYMTDHSPCIWHIHTWPITLLVSNTYIHDRSLSLDTRRVVGHVCMCQIQEEWSVMYVCVRYKKSDRSCMYVLETMRVVGHVCRPTTLLVFNTFIHDRPLSLFLTHTYMTDHSSCI
jgi:hypothetical protein